MWLVIQQVKMPSMGKTQRWVLGHLGESKAGSASQRELSTHGSACLWMDRLTGARETRSTAPGKTRRKVRRHPSHCLLCDIRNQQPQINLGRGREEAPCPED